jgi:Tol biopolymer transport system component
MVVGTVRYMSPEQAAGLPVDTRTDIWAFGCVLYEMLAGQQPFQGRTNMETLASVIKGEPDWTGLARIPPGIARVVRRCLQKDLRQRFQHIVDVRLALDDALSMADADATPASMAPRKPWALAAIVAAAAVAAGAGGTFLLRPAPRAEAGVVRFEIAPPATQPFDGRPPGLNFAISPAGSTVVYHATVGDDVQLVRRDLDSVQGTPIPGTARAQSPTFSPDGRQLAFYADGAIRTVPVTGGSPIVVCEWPGLAPFLAWLDTGDIGIAAPRELLKVPATGGVPRTLVTASAVNDEGGFFGISGLPGGGLLTLIVPAPGGRSRVRLGALAPGASALKIIIDDGSSAGYGKGHLLLTRQGKFIGMPFNPERLEVTGQPIVLENDPQHQFAVAQNGAYITVAEDPGDTDNPAGARLEWLTGDESRGHLLARDLQNARHPRVSPDGTRLAVVTGGLNYGSIWIYDLVRPSQPIKITFRGGAGFPVWRPDGRAVTFTLAGPDLALGLYSVASDGSQLEPTKVLDQYPVTPEDFRADGSALLYAAVSARSGSDLLLLDTATGRTRPWLQTPFNEGEARFSPDGRLVAYVSDQTGRSEIWLRSFEGAASLVRVSSDGGHEPRWSPDGRRIYFQHGGDLLVAAVEPSPTLRVATAHVVESGLIPFNTYFRRSYDVAPDGRVVATRMTATPSSGKLIVVLHALESLGQ